MLLGSEQCGHSFMQRLSFGRVKTVVWTGRNMGGRVIKMKEQKCFKTIDIVNYALEVIVNGVTCCAFVVHLRSSGTF